MQTATIGAGVRAIAKFILNRAIGPYLVEKLSMKQLECTFAEDGTSVVVLRDLDLDPEVMGDSLENQIFFLFFVRIPYAKY